MMRERSHKAAVGIALAAMILVIGAAAAQKIDWSFLSGSMAGDLLLSTPQEEETSLPAWGQTEKTTGQAANVPEEWNRTDLTVQGLHFEIHAAEISKESGGIPRPEFGIPNDVLFDDEDTLISDHSYVRVKLTIGCQRDEETVVSLNNTTLYIYENKEELGSRYGNKRRELVSMDVKTDGPITQRFHYTMQPGQEQDFIFHYIVEDKYITEKAELVLNIAPGGNGPQTPLQNVGYVRLAPLLEEGA